MTYEWGWREGPPRPTAPINYVKQSLDYAITSNIPPNKILMGMSLYGYDWTISNNIKSVKKETNSLPTLSFALKIEYNTSILYVASLISLKMRASKKVVE